MQDDIRARAIQLYDAFTHEHLDRRALLREMAALAGSVAAAEALIAGIAASPAAAQQVPEDAAGISAETLTMTYKGVGTSAYVVTPATRSLKATVLVIHENRGLTPHIRDVARRVALAGFVAIAPDLLSSVGGTPPDEDKARTMIGTLDLAQTTGIVVEYLRQAKAKQGGNGRAGIIGFCWGGAMVNRVAVAAGKGLDAGVSYYGPAPDPAEAVKVQAPLMLQYAGNDARVAQTGEPWVTALKAAGKTVEAFSYPGVEHAFNNDTSAARYNADAAKLAWDRTTAFLHKYLDA